MSKRAKPGDVLEIKAGARFIYLHYIGQHPEYGGAVLVSPRLHQRQASLTREFFADGYITFYPVTAALSQELVEIVGHLPPPNMPSRWRRAGAIIGRQIKNWVIEDESGEVLREKLSDEEQRLPIAAIWNHALLIQRVAEGWTPLQSGGTKGNDVDATEDTGCASNDHAPRTIWHYLYVPNNESAATVGKELKLRGFKTEERLGGDGVNWLVLATHEAVLSEELIESTRSLMEAVVSKVGGEYDGWEVDVRPPDGSPPLIH